MDLSLEERLTDVRGRIARACERAGRPMDAVTLVAVSKTMPPEAVSEAYSLGVRHFGENRVQEARDKAVLVGPGPEWHLIGTLQANKVRQAVRLFNIIHSIDSLDLLEEVSREAVKQQKIMRVLLEVNVSGELSKHGFDPEGAAQAVRRAAALPNLRPEGLMTMAPLCDNPETARPVFRDLRTLFERIRDSEPVGEGWRSLSMGMTNDFEVAIAEGATLVRVGRAVFGDRPAVQAQ